MSDHSGAWRKRAVAGGKMRFAFAVAAPLLLAGCLSPLHRAAARNDVAALRALRDSGASFREGRPVGTAVQTKNNEALAFLLENGADPDERWSGSSALSNALIVGNWDAVKILLDHGADAAAAADEYEAWGKGVYPQKTWPGIEAKAERLRRMGGLPKKPEAAPKPAAPGPSVRSAVDSPSYRAPQRPNDLAVVVGIDGYKDLPNAEFAERDADAVAAHLEALGVPKRHIVSLKGENATRTGLTKYLEEWLPRNAKRDSTVYFYFSGHGAPDTRTGKAYLVPWDGDASFLKSTALPLEALHDSLAKLPAKRVIVALDACFSGAGGRSVLAKGARPLVTKVDLGAKPVENMTTLTAASADQITATLDSEGHGLFTYYLLEGLNGAAADAAGKITATGLFGYLRPKVQDEARLQNREQTPSLFFVTDPVLR